MLKHLLLIAILGTLWSWENPLKKKEKGQDPAQKATDFKEIIPLSLIGGLTLQKQSENKNHRLVKVDLPFNHNKRDLLHLLAIRHTILPEAERELSWEEIQSSSFIDLGLKYFEINNNQELTEAISLTLKGNFFSGRKAALILYHPITLQIAHVFDGLVSKGSDEHFHQVGFNLNIDQRLNDNLAQYSVAIQVKDIEWPLPEDYYQLTILRPKNTKQYLVSKSLKPIDFLKKIDGDIDYQTQINKFMNLESDHLFKYIPQEWNDYKDRGMWVIGGHDDLMTVPNKSMVLTYFTLRDVVEASLVKRSSQSTLTVDQNFSLPSTFLFEKVEIELKGTYQMPVLKYIPEPGDKGHDFIMGSLLEKNGQAHQVHFSIYSYSHHGPPQAITNWGDAPYIFSRLHDKWENQHPFLIQGSLSSPKITFEGIDWKEEGNAFYIKNRQSEKLVQLNGSLHPDYHHLKNLSGALRDRYGMQLGEYNGYTPTTLRSKDLLTLTFTTYFSALRN
jgi:hypothetical protein